MQAIIYQKELELVNKQLDKEKNQKEILEQQLSGYQEEMKLNDFYKSFEHDIMESKTLNFLNNIYNDITKTIEQKFLIYFQNHIRKKMRLEINEISLKENFRDCFRKQSQKMYKDAIKKFSNDTKHLIILIIGKSGVGKSTLINGILKEDRAETLLGRPCTQGIKYYESQNIRLWDTQGIELSENNNLDQVIKNTKELMLKNNNLGDPDKYIHCIWYCTTGQRFEQVEEKSVKILQNIYDDNSLPLIIVYTLALSDQIFEGMKESIKKEFLIMSIFYQY